MTKPRAPEPDVILDVALRDHPNGLSRNAVVQELKDSVAAHQAPKRSHVYDPKSMIDQVAAHQAECSCHAACWYPDDTSCCDRDSGEGDARDSGGQPWRVDPLCKVRPEAKG